MPDEIPGEMQHRSADVVRTETTDVQMDDGARESNALYSNPMRRSITSSGKYSTSSNDDTTDGVTTSSKPSGTVRSSSLFGPDRKASIGSPTSMTMPSAHNASSPTTAPPIISEQDSSMGNMPHDSIVDTD